MTEFPRHTPETAPGAAGDTLRGIQKAWGFIPNLHATLAEAPTVLTGYDALFGLVREGTLTPAEQQVVFLAVSRFHECEYCVAGHSVLAGQAKLDPAVLEAVREGGAISNRKLAALRDFATAVVADRGHVSPAGIDAFLGAGYTQAQILEVVLIVASKTISNYVNHLTHTPNDAFMANTAWTAPSRRAA